MTKPKALDQFRAERQLAQEQHKLERLENRKKYLEKGERTKRTHRLCNRAYRPQFRQKRKRLRSPAGPRRLGTATHISASLSRKLSAFFGSPPDKTQKRQSLPF